MTICSQRLLCFAAVIGLSGYATATTTDFDTVNAHQYQVDGVNISTFALTSGKTFNVTNSLTLSGTDGSTLNIGAGGTLAVSATTDTTNASNISSGTLNASRLPASVVQTTGTFTLTGSYDFSGASLVNLPSGVKVGGNTVGAIGRGLLLTGQQYYPEDYAGANDGKILTDVTLNGTTTIASASANFVSGAVNNVHGANQGGDVNKCALVYGGLPVNFTGTTTAGSPTITGVSSTAALRVGMAMEMPVAVYTTATSGYGSAVLTVTSAAGLVPGMMVAGPGVSGLTISSIAGTAVTLSGALSVSISGEQPYSFFIQNIPLGTTISSLTSSTVTLSADVAQTGLTATKIFAFPSTTWTTIASVTDSNHAVLASAPSVSFTDARVIYGTNNTTAIQTAVNNIESSGLSGTLQFGAGLYLVNGALQTTGGRNGIILLPNVASGGPVSITLRGTGAPPNSYNGGITNMSSSIATGTTIMYPSTASGVNPSLFDANAGEGGLSVTSVILKFEDINFRTTANPTVGALNAYNGGTVIGKDVGADIDFPFTGYGVFPTDFSSATAFILPNTNNGGGNSLTNFWIVGYGTGVESSFATILSDGYIWTCGVGRSVRGEVSDWNINFLGNFYNYQTADNLYVNVFGSVGFADTQGGGFASYLFSFCDFDPFTNSGTFGGQMQVSSQSNDYILGNISDNSRTGSLNILFCGPTSDFSSFNQPTITGPLNFTGTLNCVTAGTSYGSIQSTTSGPALLNTSGLGFYASPAGAQVNTPLNLNNVPTTTVSGSTSGTATFSEPMVGGSFRRVYIDCSSLVGSASYTFPVSFAVTPVILTTSGPSASVVTALTTTGVTVTGANTSGLIILEGY